VIRKLNSFFTFDNFAGMQCKTKVLAKFCGEAFNYFRSHALLPFAFFAPFAVSLYLTAKGAKSTNGSKKNEFNFLITDPLAPRLRPAYPRRFAEISGSIEWAAMMRVVSPGNKNLLSAD
jgi:hypothetical protein